MWQVLDARSFRSLVKSKRLLVRGINLSCFGIKNGHIISGKFNHAIQQDYLLSESKLQNFDLAQLPGGFATHTQQRNQGE